MGMGMGQFKLPRAKMKGQTNKQLLERKTQRKLRRNMIDAELRLWQCLKSRQLRGFKFRRQHPFEDFILDFVCLEALLVIEVDGGQHVLNAIGTKPARKI
jgi:very-short-patch-repair endonuclease